MEWADGSMPVGSEQRPGRPGVIVSNDEDNARLNTVQVVYLTTKEKPPRPTHVKVVCKMLSTALCEQLYTVDKMRLGNYVRTCTDAEMAAIERGIMAALGIEQHVPDPVFGEPRFSFDEMEQYAKIEVERNTKVIAAERDTYKGMVEQVFDRIFIQTGGGA